VTALLPPEPALGHGRRVLVVSGSVGAGHDGAARELAERLRAEGVGVDVRDFLDATPRWLAVLLREGYSGSVEHVPFAFELLFSRMEHHGPIWRIARAMCTLADGTVAGWLADGAYDAVVSTYPLASQSLGRLRERGLCPPSTVTYLTDPAAHCSWVHPAVDVHLTVTEATAAQGRRDYGLPMVAAGPLVPARFTEPVPALEMSRLRRELNLPSGRRMALLVAGSLGIGDLIPTVQDVVDGGMTPVVLCGRSDRLREKVAAVPGAVALGWRRDVHALMRLADVLVHNAGGLSFTEAMVAGLPAVTYRPIPGHGRANAAVLDDAGLAPWARTRAELWAALDSQVQSGRRAPRAADPTDQVLALLAPAALAA
jgi:processive 1,2-diacylglycerol beta-glucosyltransferase